MSERFLTDLIRRKRYTVTEVAKTIGVAVSTVYDWNENAPIVQLYEISKCIGVPFHEIVDCYDPESPPPVILPTDRH